MSGRKKCRSYLRDDPGRKKRVVISDGDTMDALVKDLGERFGVTVAELQDPSGCVIERIEDIFEDDTLVIVPVERLPAPPDVGGAASDSKSRDGDGSGAGGGEGGAAAAGAGPAGAGAGMPASGIGGEHTGGAELSVVELQMLSCASVSDFVIDMVVASGQNGVVFATKCTLPGLPRPNKTYALKLVFNFGVTTRSSGNEFEHEYKVLSHIHPHTNLSRFWGTFWDKIPDDALPHLPEFAREQANYADHDGKTQRRKAQFIIFDFHPQSLEQHLHDLRPLAFPLCGQFVLDLLAAVAHMDKHRVAHLDLKLDNVLVAIDGRLVVCDFGSAIQFKDNTMSIPYHPGMSPGGNLRHLAPEVLNYFNRLRATDTKGSVTYERQEVWAVGVMCYEMALGVAPWPDYPTECLNETTNTISYDISKLAPLPDDYPPEFSELVKGLLAFDPSSRVTAALAHEKLRGILASHGVSAGPVRPALVSTPSMSSVTGGDAPVGTAADAGSAADGSGSGGASAGESVSVTVKSVTGSVAVIKVRTSDRVGVLRERATKVLMPDGGSDGTLLLYAGSRLDDEWKVGDFGLEAESCLHLVRPPTARPAVSEDAMLVDSDGSPATGSAVGAATSTVSTAGAGRTAADGGGPGGKTSESAEDGKEEPPAVVPTFSRDKRHAVVELSDGDTTASGSTKTWGTVLVEQPFVTSGRHVWKFRIDCLDPRNKGGMAIGIVTRDFVYESGILGAHRESWGYSGRTGDKGDGSGFVSYGERYGTLDTVGIDLDIDAGVLRFSKNGRDQGVAFRGDFRHKALTAAVCIGGVQRPAGFHRATLTRYLNVPAAGEHGSALAFDPTRRHEVLELSNGNITATGSKRTWGTVLVGQTPVTTGRYQWKFVIDKLTPSNKGGMAVGVVSTAFNWREGILGAHAESWGYSGRTGDKGDGTGFVPFGDPFGTGDVIGVDLDMNAGTLRFSRNGEDQGVAFTWGLKGKTLMAAVCIGGVHQGFHQVTIASGMEVQASSRRFSSVHKHAVVALSNGNCTATGSVRTWGTVLLDQERVSSGRHRWEFMVDCLVPSNKGGMAVGVVSADFAVETGILGAHANSWGYSGRTGDKGDGTGFVPYGEKYGTGDALAVELDCDKGELTFFKNGVSQGVAFTGLSGQELVPAVCIGGVERENGYHEITVLP